MNLTKCHPRSPPQFSKFCAYNTRALVVFTLLVLSNLLFATEPKNTFKLTHEEKTWLAKHPKIIAGGEADWAPYGFIDSNGDYAGIANEYLKIIENKLGIDIEVIAAPPWNDILNRFHQQEIDLLPAIQYSRDRNSFLFHTTPYLKASVAIFVQEDTHNIQSIHDLSGKTVATINGFVLENKLRSLYPNIIVLSTPSIEAAIESLNTGRADAFIGVYTSTNYNINKLAITNIKAVKNYVLHSPTIHMGIRKDWPELKDMIQKVLDSIEDNHHRKIKTCWLYQKSERCLTP